MTSLRMMLGALCACLSFVQPARAQGVDVHAAFLRADAQLRVLVAQTEQQRGLASSRPDAACLMPRSVNADGSLRLEGENDWCSGFYPGMLWHMYRYTLDGYWKRQAECNTWLLERVQHHSGSHDIGFMIGCSFGKAYELTGDNRYRDILLQSARTLISRYDPTVGCIRSWSWGGDRWRYPVIIDNMMNLELLFEASRISGDSTYQRVAVSHADRTLAHHFRDDASSYHVVDYDPADGTVRRRMTFQGHHDESVWSRGQAWGLYGYTVCYRYTHDEAYLHQAQRIARFFFAQPQLPADLIPYWDMKDPRIEGNDSSAACDVPRDASAAAIFASGLYELALYSEPADARTFRFLADRILTSLVDGYQCPHSSSQGFLLQHSTGNHPGGDEIDTSINYADYYYLEALTRACRREPLAVDHSRSLEAELALKPSLSACDLPDMRITVPLSTGRRAQGPAGDPDYAIYGTCTARLELGDIDAKPWNRLSFDVSNDLDAGVANVNVVLEGDSPEGLGAHLVNIPAGGKRHVDYEIDEHALTRLRAIRLYTDIKGRNISRRDSVHYHISHLRLEHVDRPEKTRGWMPDAGTLAYSTSGYLPDGDKHAIAAADGPRGRAFQLLDAASGQPVFSGKAQRRTTSIGTFDVLDFTSCRESGRYVLHFGDAQSQPFVIGPGAMDSSIESVLNFIYCQRCGDAVSGIHGNCHTDVYADHEGQSYPYGGGWHDAGDLSQQTLQTADVVHSLLEAYAAYRDDQPALAHRLKDEALFGLRQVLRCRFGDGYHASSIGLLHWTDGLACNGDDIHTVRQQNLAFDNFLYAAYEAHAARLLADSALAVVAAEDFAFAREKYERDGFDTFVIEMEHTYNTSYCTFMAAASWAASQLYALHGTPDYARLAADYADEMLACQEREGKYAGFFYRDKSHRVPVHFIHQSREQLPVEALAALCASQPEHPKAKQWMAAAALYGRYLKRTIVSTSPYGMLPSGVYKPHEYDDADAFAHLHLWAPADAHERFDAQLATGVSLGRGLTLRRFPAWFSIFNGNEAIHLSSGKAAAICARMLDDDTLRQIARDQLYWTLGRNPFRQSLIYGEGQRYAELDNFSSGDVAGAMPVGIRSYGDSDEPYWPKTNNACYKEVWLTSAGKWMSLVAELKGACR